MSRFVIVIADPEKARAHQRRVNLDHHVLAQRRQVARALKPYEVSKIERAIDQTLGPLPESGSLHATVDSFACPDGLSNCRDCGDPEHAAQCRAAGHCPGCGTLHGVAPQRVFADGGFAILTLDDVQAELASQHGTGASEWDTATKRFKKRSQP